MFSVLLSTLLAVAGGGDAPKEKELFAKEDWYRNQEGKEEAFTGVLKFLDRGKVIGFGRFNPYRLEMMVEGKPDVREVYIGGKPDILKAYVNKKVKLTGKAVDIGVEGRRHREIWPARVEVLADASKKEEPKEGASKDEPKSLKILARAPWRHVQANPNGPKQGQQFVIRSIDELTGRPPWNQSDAPQQVIEKRALDDVCKALKVESIDWTKQMLVVVTAGVKNTGGYKIDITSVSQADKELVIAWSVAPPKGIATQAFTHPALLALVERGEGTPKFVLKSGR